jgi:hypothetical protein
MKNARLKYSEGGSVRLTELRRFVLIDDTPRCSEGHVLGIMFRKLAKQGVQRVLSYADPSHNHVGTIYRGTGFQCLGQTPRTQVVRYQNQKISTRSLRRCAQDRSCDLRPDAKRLRAALESGEATLEYEAGKFIYLKELKVPASASPSTAAPGEYPAERGAQSWTRNLSRLPRPSSAKHPLKMPVSRNFSDSWAPI